MFQGCLRGRLERPDGDAAQQAHQPQLLPRQRWDICEHNQQQAAGKGPWDSHVSTKGVDFGFISRV